MTQPLPTPSNSNKMFVTWASEKDKAKAINDLAVFHSEESVWRRKSKASINSAYRNVDTNVNVRPEFSESNYDYFRPQESTPKKRKEIVGYCEVACERIGLVKNVIDLMGDFAAQGIKIVHKEDKAQKVANAWAKRVNLNDRAERFLNMFYSLGTVGIYRQVASINRIDLKKLQQSVDPESIVVDDARPQGDIPIQYSFIHPNCLEVIGGELALFGQSTPKYGLNLPESLRKKILSPSNPEEKAVVADLPDEVKLAAKNNKIVPLGDNFSCFFYKKKDWEQFPKPMIYAILDDLIMLEKLKLTDKAACDGAISSVRLWTLGDLANRILPTPAAIAKLSDILTNNVGGGCYDLVWDATLKFQESSSDISKFLGEEKYIPTLNRIYSGLGVPPTLTGAATSSGFTNNYISLKTLTERLGYGRMVLTNFLNQELAMLQKALGLREAFQVTFDRMTLSDEAAEKALLIQLLDRNVISDETILDRFGEYADIERSRVKGESKQRDGKTMPDKAGQFHSPQRGDEYKKMFIQTGQVTPSQLGLELGEKKPGEKTPLEIKVKSDKEKIKQSGGRPLNSKDGKKRKQKVVKPRTSASFVDVSLWAQEAYGNISKIVTPKLVEYCGKTTARALTDKELGLGEKIKLDILSQITPFTEITEVLVASMFNQPAKQEILVVYNNLVDNYIQRNGKEPTIDYLRQLQVYAYSLYNQE